MTGVFLYTNSDLLSTKQWMNNCKTDACSKLVDDPSIDTWRNHKAVMLVVIYMLSYKTYSLFKTALKKTYAQRQFYILYLTRYPWNFISRATMKLKLMHYSDATQATWPFIQQANTKNTKAPHCWPPVSVSTGDRWIPVTNGLQHGERF